MPSDFASEDFFSRLNTEFASTTDQPPSVTSAYPQHQPVGHDHNVHSNYSLIDAYNSVALPGIPVSNGKLKIGWRVRTIVVFAILLIGWLTFTIIKAYLLDLDIPLDLVKHRNLSINVQNCHVFIDRVNDIKTNPLLSVSAWLIAMKSGSNNLLLPDKDNVVVYDDEEGLLSVNLEATYISTYFQCSIRLYLPDDFEFEQVSITAVPDDPYVTVRATQTVRAKRKIIVDIFHGIVELESVEAPKLDFRVGDGSLKFHLDGEVSRYLPPASSSSDSSFYSSLRVQTVSAPCFIKTANNLKIITRNTTAQRSLFRSDGDVDVHRVPMSKGLVRVTLYPQEQLSDNSDPLELQYVAIEGPLYVIGRGKNVDLQKTDLMTWAGQLQQTPRLLDFSLTRLDELKSWIANDPSANWIASLKMTGEGLPNGHWRFLSSPAFIDFNFWFMVTSAGLLTPRTLSLHVHLLGMYCTWNDLHGKVSGPSTLLLETGDFASADEERSNRRRLASLFSSTLMDNDDEENLFDDTQQDLNFQEELPGKYLNATGVSNRCGPQIMDRGFRVFWTTFKEIHAPSVYPLWKNGAGQHFFFDIHIDSVVIKLVDPWEFEHSFICAVVVNILVSLAAATWITSHVFQSIDRDMIAELINDANIDKEASHRLDHEIGHFSAGAWHISVSRLDRLRGHFFRIRWVPRDHKMQQIAIHICPVKEGSQKKEQKEADAHSLLVHTAGGALQKSEVFFTLDPKLVIEHVATLAGVQDQICIPFRYPCPVLYEFPSGLRQRWLLAPKTKYRFRLLAIGQSSTVLAHSDWSQEVVLGDYFQFYGVPSMCARRLKSAKMNSLSLFLLKHCFVCRPPSWDLTFGAIHLEVFTKTAALDDASPYAADESPSLASVSEPLAVRRNEPSSRSAKEKRNFRALKVAMYVGADGMKARHMTDATGQPVWHQCLLEDTHSSSRDLLSDAASKMYSSSPHHHNVLSLLTMNSVDREFNVEVTSPAGGRALAYGAVPIEGIQLAASHHLASYWDDHKNCLGTQIDPTLSIKINLSSSTTNEPWGKMEAWLDTSPLIRYIRHKFPSDPGARTGRRQSIIATTQPCFLRDPAGQMLYIGVDHVVRWYWPSVVQKPDNIYIHVLEDISNTYCISLHDGKPIQNTGTFNWPIFLPMEEKEIVKQIRLVLSDGPYSKENGVRVLAQSHCCFVVRTLPLSILEFHYAAFCRSANLPMLQVSPETLVTHGVSVSYHAIRVCCGMREKLPFEEEHELIFCPGQVVVSASAIITRLYEKGFSPTSNEERIGTVDVVKSQNLTIPVVENIYLVGDPWFWTSSPDLLSMARNEIYFLPGVHVYRSLANTVSSLAKVTRVKTGQLKREDDVALDSLHLLPISLEAFFKRRWILFELTPTAFQSFFVVLNFVGDYVFDVCFLLLILFSNFLILFYEETERDEELDPRWVSDVVFASNPFLFIQRMPMGWTLAVCGSLLLFWSGVFIDFFWQEATDISSFFYMLCERLSFYHRILRVSVFMTVHVSFMLWFLATALCWSDSYFPYLVVIGAIAFVVYSVSRSYDTGQAVVHKFVSGNLPRLLGLALDGWFDATNAEFIDFKRPSDKEDSKLATARIRDALKSWRTRARRFKGLERLQFFESGGEALEQHKVPTSNAESSSNPWALEEAKLANLYNQYTFSDPFHQSSSVSYSRAKQSRFFEDKVARWHLDLWSTPRGDPFIVNENCHLIRGDLEHLPIAARLASVEEVEKEYFHEITAVVPPSVINVPIAFEGGSLRVSGRDEVQVNRGLSPGAKFWKALVLSPIFPPARSLSYTVKLGMIFNYFDEQQRGRWREWEFRAWLAALRKPGVRQNWINLQRKMKIECRMRIHPVLGCSITDLDKYYKTHKIIDQDYSVLFPNVVDGSTESGDELSLKEDSLNEKRSEDSQASSSESENSESSSESSEASDLMMIGGETKRTHETDSESESESSESGAEQEEIARKLKEDLNARKLFIIYNHSTQIHRDHKVDELLNQTNTFTIKLLEIQFRILSPIFGEQMLFKAGGHSKETLKLFREMRTGVKRDSSNPFIMGGAQEDDDDVENDNPSTTRWHRAGTRQIRWNSSDASREWESAPSVHSRASGFHQRMSLSSGYDEENYDEQSKSSSSAGDKKPGVRFNLNPLAIDSTGKNLKSPPRLGPDEPLTDHYANVADFHMTRSFTTILQSGIAIQNQEIHKRFRNLRQMIFETESVSRAVTAFYDQAVVDKTQRLALWILTPHLDILHQKIHPRNKEFYYSSMPKPLTAHHLAKLLHQYYVANQKHLDSLLALSRDPRNSGNNLSVFLVFQIFCDLMVLRPEEVGFYKKTALYSNNKLISVNVMQPISEDLTQFLASQIEFVCGSTKNLSSRDLIRVCISIMSEYFWFDAFWFMLRLMGLKLDEEELPGWRHWQLPKFGCTASEASTPQESRRTVIYRQNKEAARGVFRSLSGKTQFLHKSLGDECVLLLTENNLNFAGACACLKTMYLDYTDHFEGAVWVADGLRTVGFTLDTTTVTVEPSKDALVTELDWTWYWSIEDREADGLAAIYHRITETSSGFISKSQFIQMVLEMKVSQFCPKTSHLDPPPIVPQDTRTEASYDLCTIEMLHQVLIGTKLTVSRKLTEIIWLMLCSEICHGRIVVRLPVSSVCEATGPILAQSCTAEGIKYPWTDSSALLDHYAGWINFPMFKFILAESRITIREKHVKYIWNSLRKEPLDISMHLPSDCQGKKYWVRVSTGKSEMDPHIGSFVRTARVFRSLPKILLTGMWPEGMRSLVAFALQFEPSEHQLNEATRAAAGKRNRYGLIKPCDVAKILTALSVEGMSFAMLEEAISKMRLTVPPGMVRQMFALMDVNHDKSLDLSELLRGFEVLFSNFIPPLIIEAVAVSTSDKLKAIFTVVGALILFFLFVALAFSSFTSGNTSATGTAMQSLLAVAGAYTMQSSAQRDERVVAAGMYRRIEGILGEGLLKRLQEQEAMERIIDAYNELDSKAAETNEYQSARKNVFIHYHIPKPQIVPSGECPTPTLEFSPGEEIWLVPELLGEVPNTPLVWQMTPPLPRSTGVNFDPATGILYGRIVNIEEHWFKNAFKAREIAEQEGLEIEQVWRDTATSRTCTILCRTEGNIIAKTYLTYRVKPWAAQQVPVKQNTGRRFSFTARAIN